MKEEITEVELTDKTTEEEVVREEPTPSMKEYEDEINRSFKKIKEGDLIKGVVIGVSDTQVNVDLGYYTEGIILLEELSNDPRFSIKADVLIGDKITAMVLAEDDGEGNISLSRKQATDLLAWDKLREAKKLETVFKVKLSEAVNAGLVTYLEGVRAFIPASQLTLSYVENLEEWVGKTIDVQVITVEEDKKKLVLSGKEVARKLEQEERKGKISKLQKGLVTTGVIESIMPYGCFVNIGEGLTGLVHISQICGRHIKHPNEEVKEGQKIKVKILDVKDGKISLSMKAVSENEDSMDRAEDAPIEYSSGEEATTGLGALLAGFKF
ncbi:MAG: S1 RNA-binding domain-containing protein [Acetivibrio sp.]